MNREVHARFWERAEVKFLRATRHERRFCDVCGTSALPPIFTVTADILNVPRTDILVIVRLRSHASKTKRVPVYERKSFVGIAARAAS